MMIVVFDSAHTEAVVQLWMRCGLTVPWNKHYQDIQRKQQYNPDGFLLGLIDDNVVASVMYGYDGHRGSVYYLAVDPKYQGRGFGKQIMTEVESRLHLLGCPKLNLMVRSSNEEVLGFYATREYKQDPVVVLSKRLAPPDEPYCDA